MKIKDIYNCTPNDITMDLFDLRSFIPDINFYNINDDINSRVTIKIHFNPYIDGTRICKISSVWFDDKPVMLFRLGGRDGRDAKSRFVTDIDAFHKMIDYLQSICSKEEVADDYRSVDEEEPELDYFYTRDFKLEDFNT